MLLFPDVGKGQAKIVAKKVVSSSHVDSPNNATVDNGTAAKLESSTGWALGPSYDGGLELEFKDEIPANVTSYIHLDIPDEGLLGVLLGGSLGKGLSSLVNSLTFGSHYIDIEAKLNTALVLSGSSKNGFTGSRVKLVQDDAGKYYVALTPDKAYNRVRIKDAMDGGLLNVLFEVKGVTSVFNAFYYEDSNADCGRPTFTSFDGAGGISLSVLPVGENTLHQAIDNSLTTASLLKSSSLLNVSIGSSLSQNFFFNTLSASSSSVNIAMALDTDQLLDIEVLSSVDVVFIKNGATVATKSISSGVLGRTDLLGLLRNGDKVTLTFAPGVEFDQVAVRLNALVGLSVTASDVEIYDVQRFDGVTCINPNIVVPTPTDPMLSNKACGGTLNGSDHVSFASNVVDGNNGTYATLEASSGIAAGIGAYDSYNRNWAPNPATARRNSLC